MGEGYVKLYRKLLDWEWYDNQNTKSLFFHCLLKANFRQSKWRGQIIPRGAFITSLGNLSKEMGLSVREIRTALNNLKSTSNLTSKTTNKYTLIKVENWALYQSDEIISDKQNDKQLDNQKTNKRQASDKQTTTDEECKERKNVKNEKKKDIKASNDAMSVDTDAPKGKTDKIDYDSICDFWNTHSLLNEITKITEQRKPNVNARIREHGIEAIYKMIDQAGQSPFLRGDNRQGFVATFDWCFKPKNFVKVLEGNYIDGKVNKTIYDDVAERVRKMNEYMGVKS